MEAVCGEAKSAGPSVCRGCCDAHTGTLGPAGCTENDWDTWCSQSDGQREGRGGLRPSEPSAPSAPSFVRAAAAFERARLAAGSGKFSFTFTGDGDGGQAPTHGCFEQDNGCEPCLEAWHANPPDASYKYGPIVSTGCKGEIQPCPFCLPGLTFYQ